MIIKFEDLIWILNPLMGIYILVKEIRNDNNKWYYRTGWIIFSITIILIGIIYWAIRLNINIIK